VTAKLNELEAEFWKAKTHFITDYASHREAALGEWRDTARNLECPILIGSLPPLLVLSRCPLEKHFGFDTQLFQIAVPEKLGMELLTMADQQQVIDARQQAACEASAKIRRDTESFVADCVASLREQNRRPLRGNVAKALTRGKLMGFTRKHSTGSPSSLTSSRN